MIIFINLLLFLTGLKFPSASQFGDKTLPSLSIEIPIFFGQICFLAKLFIQNIIPIARNKNSESYFEWTILLDVLVSERKEEKLNFYLKE